MLVKVALVFLLAMAGLAMIGKALGLRRPGRPRLPGAALCKRCGRLLSPGESCSCGTGPRA